MKQMFSLLLLAAVLVSMLAGCGSPAAPVETEVPATEASASAPTAIPETEAVPDDADTAVVYFSGTGNTEKIAQNFAAVLDVPVYQILPETPYTAEDLNYRNDGCRVNQEMNDDTARPAISNDLSALSGIKKLYLGYPIWWGTAPRIIQTFLESVDLEGTEIYLFCTSGSSGIEKSIQELQAKYPRLNIRAGKRFANGASPEDIQAWIDNQ